MEWKGIENHRPNPELAGAGGVAGCGGLVFGLILMSLSQLAAISGGSGILDFKNGYTPEKVAKILGSYGVQGMKVHARIQSLDLFNPVLYSLVAVSLTAMIWRGRGPYWLALFLLLGGLGHYLENVTGFKIASDFPMLDSGLIVLSSNLSLLKNALLLHGMLPLIAGLGLWLLRRSGSRRA